MVQLQRLAIAPEQLQNEHLSLTAEQQHYLGRVLRLKQGDRFIIIESQWWIAELLVNLPASSPQAKLIEKVSIQTELPIEVILIVALPKADGFEDIVRCCTELGVTQFIPVISKRTLLKPSPQKVERWRKIAREAAEQSERLIIPNIFDPVSFQLGLEKNAHSGYQYICEGRGNYSSLTQELIPLEAEKRLNKIILAIGPEGGWTEAEIKDAIAIGFQPVSLGKRILRAVTAPIVAVSQIVGIIEK
ncbi:MAG TPA: 16S rRNA (uracil(1498)-N(3))-methyltransferase [Candidatus Obscuribacterales bacterium]